MRRAVLATVLAALVGASCASTPATSPKGTGSTSTSRSTTRPPARTISGRILHRCADGGHTTAGGCRGCQRRHREDPAHRQSVYNRRHRRSRPDRSGQAIPAGPTPDLLLPVMLVQSDLMSRFYALRGFERAINGTSGTVVPLSDQLAQDALSCLGNGTQAAASFAADLAVARATAAKAPPVTVAAPDSRTAADLSVLLQNLVGRNSGCMSCGGERETSLPTITWYATRMPAGFHGHPGPVDGNVNGVDFLANYTLGTGWDVQAYAC